MRKKYLIRNTYPKSKSQKNFISINNKFIILNFTFITIFIILIFILIISKSTYTSILKNIFFILLTIIKLNNENISFNI